MRFQTFENAANHRVYGFFVWWKENHDRDPMNWPMNMPEPEWWEHFKIYLEDIG